MIHPMLLVFLSVLMLGSLQREVSSVKTPFINPVSHKADETAHVQQGDDFVPDVLTVEEDDADHETVKKPKKVVGNGRRKLLTTRKATPSPQPSSRHERLEKPRRARRRLLKDTGPSVNLLALTSNPSSNAAMGTLHSVRPEFHPSTLPPGNSASSSPSFGGLSERGAPATEEAKLRTSTRKLVKWLRNRLRKRLEDVANLEERCDVEKTVLTRLNETIGVETSKRENEIKTKLETQHELKSIERRLLKPDQELQEIRSESSTLVDQLARLKKAYDTLAATKKKAEDRLVSAGFTHWLDKRGDEYMPATAVGVLSKSVRLLDPVSRGIEEVARLDELFSSGVERMLPISEKSLIAKVVGDMAALVPIIPVVLLIWRIHHISYRLSLLHIVMYIAAIFVFESMLTFVVSICIGTEAIREMQQSHELFVVVGAFVNVLLYLVMMAIQALITVVRTSRSEVMQCTLSVVVGYHFFRTVFQPVVVSKMPSITTVAHVMYAINFALIAFEKKVALKVGTRFDKHLNNLLVALEKWTFETLQAMQDMFIDTLPELSDYSSRSSSNHDELPREVDTVVADGAVPVIQQDREVPEAAQALNASTGYGRWSGRPAAQPRIPGRAGFQGNRGYRRAFAMESESRIRTRQGVARQPPDESKRLPSAKEQRWSQM